MYDLHEVYWLYQTITITVFLRLKVGLFSDVSVSAQDGAELGTKWVIDSSIVMKNLGKMNISWVKKIKA